MIHRTHKTFIKKKSWAVFYHFDEFVKLTVGQKCFAWSKIIVKQLPPCCICSSPRELAVLLECEAVAGSQNENQPCKDTVLCKYQQLQSFHYMDLCVTAPASQEAREEVSCADFTYQPTHRISFSQLETFITAIPCCQNDNFKDMQTEFMFYLP